MNLKYITKKQIKNLKKRITNETAVNVGFYYRFNNINLFDIINLNHFLDVLQEDKNFILELLQNAKNKDIENILITEIIKKMKYQEFKKIANYFF